MPAPSRSPAALQRATLAVLDISEYYSDRSGGVRTYLDAKTRYVAGHADVRRTLLIPGARDEVEDRDGTRIYRLKGPAIPLHSYRLMLATRSVARIIERERPDVIELGSSYAVPWVVSRSPRRAATHVAWFYHSNLPRLVAPQLESAGPLRRLMVNAIGEYVRRLASLADVTIAASAFAESELRRWGVKRVERTTLGVDIDRFTPERRIRSKGVRARLGLGDAPLVGFAGRLASEKRVDHLVRAWPAVARRTGAVLVIVGDGPQRKRLEALAEGHQIVMMPHETDRDAFADLLAALDLYVSAAPYETFGLAVCEALASGVPVVSVDHGAAAELVRNSGAGWLVPPDDVAALAEGIVEGLQHDRKPLSERARTHVERHHDWQVVLHQQFEMYRRWLR